MKRLFLIPIFLLLTCPAFAAPGQLVDCQTSPQSITTGGADQTQLAQNNQRTTVVIENYCSATTQNISVVESLWVNFGAAAAQGTGIELAACGSYVFSMNYPVQQALHIFAGTTGHRFACKANQ
jgi:hypothetical protein